jgi:hypothetical protein
MISKILLAGAAALALSSVAFAQTAPSDAAGGTTPAQTTRPEDGSMTTGQTESRPDSQGPTTPQQSSPAGAASTPPANADDPNSATGMRGDSGYGPGWDAGKCAAAKKAGTKTNSGDCPTSPRPR